MTTIDPGEATPLARTEADDQTDAEPTQDKPKAPKPRVCPHCHRVIERLPPKPRDLGLILHYLLHRVPIQSRITAAQVERARAFCHMRPARLAALQAEPHARHWRSMLGKRARRLAWLKEHGEPPPDGWSPPGPGEPDRLEAVAALRVYWWKVRPFVAKMKRRPGAQHQKLTNRYLATRKIRSPSKRMAALDRTEALMMLQHMATEKPVDVWAFARLYQIAFPEEAQEEASPDPLPSEEGKRKRAGGQPAPAGPPPARPATHPQ